jgi:hypothetical protein
MTPLCTASATRVPEEQERIGEARPAEDGDLVWAAVPDRICQAAAGIS